MKCHRPGLKVHQPILAGSERLKNTEILDETNSFRKNSLSIFFVRLSKFDSKLAAAIKNTFWNLGPLNRGSRYGPDLYSPLYRRPCVSAKV